MGYFASFKFINPDVIESFTELQLAGRVDSTVALVFFLAKIVRSNPVVYLAERVTVKYATGTLGKMLPNVNSLFLLTRPI